jgi:hypothetical protein
VWLGYRPGDCLAQPRCALDLTEGHHGEADADIRSDVVEGIVRGSMWLDPSIFDVEVDDGAVRIHGEVHRRSDVEILINLIRGVDGVIDVDAALTYRFDDRNIRPPKELGGI